MLREKAIRVRIERILRGDIRPLEIGLIFADLRFLQKLPAEVRDLADFPAHRPDRDRGHTLATGTQLFNNLEDYLSGRVPAWTAKSGYSDIGVVTALRTYLITTSIFQETELTDVSSLTTPIALYALASMHGCILRRRDGSVATLAIRGGAQGTLEMGCMALMPTKPEVNVNLCVFSTSVGIDAAIGRLRSGLPPSDPDTTVEVTFKGQLRYLENHVASAEIDRTSSGRGGPRRRA